MTYKHSGTRAELQFAKQFNYTWMDWDTQRGRRAQLADIDVIREETTTEKQVCFSIKDELRSSKDYGSILVETMLEDTRTGQTMDGWFKNSKAHYLAYKITWKSRSQWLTIKHSDLEAYMEANILPTRRTKETTEAYNRSKGRKFDRAYNKAINLAALIAWGTESGKVKVQPVRNTK